MWRDAQTHTHGACNPCAAPAVRGPDYPGITPAALRITRWREASRSDRARQFGRPRVSIAAATVEATRTPLFDELETTLGGFSSLVKPAQHAVATVARSLVADSLLTEAERDLSTALFVLAQALR
jgi:hypothetical protein